ncbi:MAG: hypothetical protein H6737_07470 [Alphaproteobacteria bacterium]|nr:hypothetical protein [Alphaproteobacteria bacterium]
MESEDPTTQRPTSVLLATTAAIYFAFAVLPAVGLMATSGGWLARRATLQPTEHLTPVMDGVGMIALVGVALTAVVSVLPAFVLGVRRLPKNIRLGVGIGLLALHVLLVVVTLGSTTAFGVLPVVLDSEKLVMRAKEPNGTRAALLYRDRGECRWNVYVSEPLDPVATQSKSVQCRCDDMRRAEVAWVRGTPELFDPQGQPFACPPPPSGCAATGSAPGWLVWLGLVALGLRAPCRPGRSAPSRTGCTRASRRPGPRPDTCG